MVVEVVVMVVVAAASAVLGQHWRWAEPMQ